MDIQTKMMIATLLGMIAGALIAIALCYQQWKK